MRNILVLGAGHSATFLIDDLLRRAAAEEWFVTVGDLDPEVARRALQGSRHGDAIAFDVHDAALRSAQIERAAVVVNFLPQHFQSVVARDCLEHRRHLISVSYQDRWIDEMAADAQSRGVLFLTEVGLDPGIDHMSAAAVIDRVHAAGGVVESFESYGSGVPAPEVDANPLRYCVTWNPRSVAMAGSEGAQYLEHGRIKIVPWHQLFHHSWPKEVPGFGLMEAYPNRDSLAYRDKLGIPETETLIRGTLRYPGWSETWHQIVRLGLPNESIAIPGLHRRCYREIVEMFLPETISGSTLEFRVANYLGISTTGRIMDNLRWLGLFSDQVPGIEGRSAADALIFLLKWKLKLPDGGRDVVIVFHQIVAGYPEDGGRRRRLTSSLIEYGRPADGNGRAATGRAATAMARTVGLPAAIATRLLLTDQLPLTGCHIPTHPAIFRPILAQLETEGIAFEETVETVE